MSKLERIMAGMLKTFRNSFRNRFRKAFQCVDCAECPLSWEDRGYEDADAGCFVYGDLYGDRLCCRLPGPVKRAMKKAISRRNDRELSKSYEGIDEWYTDSEKRDAMMKSALQMIFPEIAFTDFDERPFLLRCRYSELCECAGLAPEK